MSDLSGNDLSGTGSFVFDEEESDLIYRSLIRPIRQMDRDQGGLFLKRYLTRPQYHFDLTAEKIRNLDSTDLPSTISDGLLQYLKDHVGLTKEMDSITADLSTSDLRKLIQLAVPLWRGKGTQSGLMDVVRLLTGRTPMYIDWFGYRFLIGESGIGEEGTGADSWLIGGESSEMDEFTSHLRIMDDGDLNEQLLLDLVGLMRPLSERIEIALVDFIDRFDINLDRWATVSTFEPIERDDVAQVGVLPPNGAASAIIPAVASSSYDNYMLQFKFKLANETDALEIFWRASGVGAADTYYSLTLKCAATRVTLKQKLTGGGAESTVASTDAAAVPLTPDAWYTVRVEMVDNDAGGKQIRVHLDSSLVMTATGDSLAAAGGSVILVADSANSEDVHVDNAEIYRLPLRYATVDKDGATYTDNFID